MIKQKVELKKRGPKPRIAGTLERKFINIKLSPEEYSKVAKMAEKFEGNMNKLFRVRILGEKE